MATVTKYAERYSVISGTWNNPTNMYADDGSYTTIEPGWLSRKNICYYFPGCEIPDGSTINSVTVELQFKLSAATGIAFAYIQAVYPNNTTLLGSEANYALNPTTDTVLSNSNTGTPTIAELNSGNFGARIGAYRSYMFSTPTFSFDYVKITVDYTEGSSAAYTLSATIGGADKSAIAFVNIEGVWKDVANISEKIGGVWK